MSQPLQETALLYRTDPASLLRFRLLPLLSVPVLFLKSDLQFRLEGKLQESEVRSSGSQICCAAARSPILDNVMKPTSSP